MPSKIVPVDKGSKEPQPEASAPEHDCAMVEANADDLTLSSMGLRHVWIIPLLTFILSISAFIVSYSIAVSLNHVSAFWPYISDNGAFSPESCVFGQLLNLSALFLAISVYLRHRQIVEFYWHQYKQVGKWRASSCILLWIGYASALGVSIVANFQESNVLEVHYFGALLAFGAGLIYCLGQTFFSYAINPKMAKPMVSNVRLVLCIFSTIFFATMIIFGPILGRHHETDESHNETDNPHDTKKGYKWTGIESNYIEHMIGTCSEWLLAICFQLYILSFAVELRHSYCHAPKLKLIAFLSTSDSAASADIFDCCVIPPTIIGRKTTPKADVACVLGCKVDEVNGVEIDMHDRSTHGNTLTTTVSDDQSSNGSLNLSPMQPEDVKTKY